MVIFLFLRNVWATIIPSVTIPVALVGTLGAMYLCGFSLDNLSLMGLTIAVGFVVDDAIVMLENIFRHIEDGMKPIDAAIKGAGEIGFTIVSISFSLIAVFIPLLLMGGIVGRLFREFAICVSITIVISAIVSLTLAPMMASRFLTLRSRTATAGSTICIERFFDGMLRFYERTLDIALRFRFITLMVFIATVTLTVMLYVVIPKGFFPTQDTGIMIGITDAAQDISFDGDVGPAAAGEQGRAGRPGGRLGRLVGRRRRRRPDRQQRPHVHHAEAVGSAPRQRHAGDRAGSIEKMQAVQRHPPVPAARAGCAASAAASAARSINTRCRTPTPAELNTWAPKILAKMQTLPQLADVTSDQEIAGTTETLTYDRDQAARFGVQPAAIDDILYDAFGQREVAQYFTGNKAYYVDPGGAAERSTARSRRCRSCTCTSATGAERCRCRRWCTRRPCRCSRWRSTIRASSRR